LIKGRSDRRMALARHLILTEISKKKVCQRYHEPFFVCFVTQPLLYFVFFPTDKSESIKVISRYKLLNRISNYVDIRWDAFLIKSTK